VVDPTAAAVRQAETLVHAQAAQGHRRTFVARIRRPTIGLAKALARGDRAQAVLPDAKGGSL